MTATLVSDGLWDMIEPLLPLPKPKPQGGRPRTPDRVCLEGIVFVLRSGHSLGNVAERAWLRLGNDLLETPARLAEVWHQDA
jgi:transposase